MNDCIDLLLLKQIIQKCKVVQVALIELCPCRNGFAVPCHQIVRHDHIFSGTHQFQCRMGTDIAGSSQY